MAANEFVDDEVRDQVLTKLLTIPENKQCFDCKSKNPKWSSSNIGVFLCYQCTSKHRSMGVHISFVRSLKMDRWKRKELKHMELGGNKNAQEYFEQNGMYKDGKPDHEAAPHARYKMELAAKAEQAIREEFRASAAEAGNQVAAQQPFEKAQAVAQQPGGMGGMGGLDLGMGLDLGFDSKMGSNDTQQQKPQEPAVIQQPTLQQVDIPVSQPATSNSAKKPSTGNKSLQQIEGGLTDAASGGFSFAKKSENQSAAQKLNAKKLDIDFGNSDDFFNSFEPATGTSGGGGAQNQSVGTNGATRKNNKLIEVEDPFEIAPGFGSSASTSAAGPTAGTNSNGYSDPFQPSNYLNDQAAREKLKQMGSRKAISSADFMTADEPPKEIKDKFAELKQTGATQISSDMMFGRASAGGVNPGTSSSLGEAFENNLMGRTSLNSGGSYDEYKDAATKVVERVGAKASQIKANAMDWFTQFTQQPPQ